MIFKTTSASLLYLQKAVFISYKLQLLFWNNKSNEGFSKLLLTVILPKPVLVTGDKLMCSTSFYVITNLL